MNPSALTSGPHSQPDLARIFEGSRPRDVLLRIDAGGFSDAADGHFFPGSMLVEISGGRRSHGPSFFPVSGRGQILAIGRPGDVDSHPASSSAWRVTMPECVVVPGFVNAPTRTWT